MSPIEFSDTTGSIVLLLRKMRVGMESTTL